MIKSEANINSSKQTFIRSLLLFWVIFAWFVFLHISGLHIFTQGFLLTRSTLNLTSSCNVPPYIPQNQKLEKNDCWYPSSFNKAIIMIIDALRYDFTIEHPDSNLYYHNALTVLHETATKYPKQAFLRPFIADPPTTTLQRLKALTTGTLPTFVDMGSNFAGTAILEDNIIAQLKSRGYRIGFLGDDTWISLYPGYFEPNITHPFDSFNVWDLDTVDNNINFHLFPLLSNTGRTQWDILILHYLGLDHSGHRYGPNHNQTARKLVEMDTTIRKIMNTLQDDTLLIVFGDHGMDEKGDHGGDSVNETVSAFWMYCQKTALFEFPSNLSSISQLDFVPTFSFLMGIPVPYNNLGGPILEAFFYNRDLNWKHYSQAAKITAYQIKRYIQSYKNAGNCYFIWKFTMSNSFLFKFNLLNLLNLVVKCIISAGLSLFLSKLSLIPLSILNSILFGICFTSILNFATFFLKTTSFTQFLTSFWKLTSVVFIIVHGLILSSNSFIVWEDRIILFSMSSIYTLFFFAAFSGHRKNIRMLAIIHVFLLLLIGKITSLIRQCREEQQPFCKSTFYTLENTAIPSNSLLILASIFLVFLPRILSRFLKDLNFRKNPTLFCLSIGFRLGLSLIAAHSIIDSELLHSNLLKHFSNEKIKEIKIMLTRIVLFVCFFIIHIIWVYSSIKTKNTKSRLFTCQIQGFSSKTYTHKLGNIYGLNYLLLVFNWFIIFSLLQKPAGVISFCFFLCQILLYLEFSHLLQIKNNSEINTMIFALLGRLHFFSTGHQATL
ncbi:hypothetical protein PCK2_000001, partial [Pneumocystis canis]